MSADWWRCDASNEQRAASNEGNVDESVGSSRLLDGAASLHAGSQFRGTGAAGVQTEAETKLCDVGVGVGVGGGRETAEWASPDN